MRRLFSSCPWKYFGWPAMALLALLLAVGCDDDAGIGPETWAADSGGSISKCGPGLTECGDKCINRAVTYPSGTQG